MEANTDVHLCAHLNDAESMAFILEHSPESCGAADASEFGDGNLPLHYAAAAAALECAALALDHKAHVDARNGSGATALLLAVQAGAADVVDLLLARGADAAAAEKTGLCPLDVAKRTLAASARERVVSALVASLGENYKTPPAPAEPPLVSRAPGALVVEWAPPHKGRQSRGRLPLTAVKLRVRAANGEEQLVVSQASANPIRVPMEDDAAAASVEVRRGRRCRCCYYQYARPDAATTLLLLVLLLHC